MNTHKAPEDKNKNPERKAPKLPEGVAMDPMIQTERDDIQGKVLYSSNPEEIGTKQSPADAYKYATDNHLATIASKEPNWLQKALITRKIANERAKLVEDDLINRREDQNRHADLLTGRQQEDWLKLQAKLEADRSRLIKQKAKSSFANVVGKVKTFGAMLGTALISPIAGGVNAWQDIRDERKNRPPSIN